MQITRKGEDTAIEIDRHNVDACKLLAANVCVFGKILNNKIFVLGVSRYDIRDVYLIEADIA
jgi:hypothetical protein